MLQTLGAATGFNRVSESFSSLYRLRSNKIHKFKPKVEISGQMGYLSFKTANSVEELKEALQLRHEVFFQEMQGKTLKSGVDVDEYDFDCDHLIIIDEKLKKIIGTYRLNCSLFSDKFYSENEFQMQSLLSLPGTKLELGRACIHKDYRRGVVISLLWRGIAQYMQATDSALVFGCATINTESPREAALLNKLFQEQGLYKDGMIIPTLDYLMPNLDLWNYRYQNGLNEQQKKEAEALVPALLRAYLKIGASLGGEPAYDSDFNCIDFLTVLRKEDLNRALWKKYT